MRQRMLTDSWRLLVAPYHPLCQMFTVLVLNVLYMPVKLEQRYCPPKQAYYIFHPLRWFQFTKQSQLFDTAALQAVVCAVAALHGHISFLLLDSLPFLDCA